MTLSANKQPSRRLGKPRNFENAKRKLVEEKIRHLASFPEHNPNPVIEVTENGKVSFVNLAAVKVLRSLKLTQKISLFFPKDFSKILKSLRLGKKYTVNRDVDIHNLFFSESISVLPELKVVRIYAKDITRRKAAEDALRWNERRNAILSGAAAMLLAADDPQVVIDLVARRAMEFLDCQVFLNFLSLPQKKELQLNAYAGISGKEAGRIAWLDYGVAGCDCPARDVAGSGGKLADLARRFGVRAYCCYPLTIGKQVIGIIFFGAQKRDKFRDEESALMKSISEVVSTAMQRKRTEESLVETRNYLENLFDYANAPIIVWSPDLKITRFNHAFEKMTGYKAGEVIGKQLEILFPEESKKETLRKIQRTASGEYWETIEIPILPADGNVKIALWNSANIYDKDGKTIISTIAQGQDITERRKKEEELNKLNKMFKALSDNNQALMRVSDESEYLEDVCRIVVRNCGYKMAWIGFAEFDELKTVRPVAQAGFEKGYLKTVDITWADTERGRGPTGTSIRSGRPAICKDILNDPDFAPWRPEALKRGYASSISLPLSADGKPFGAIMLYSTRPDPFSEREVKLLSELADDISYGITALRLRAAHAKAEEETKKAHFKTMNILQSITEAYIVFDRQGRFVELNRCAEDLLGRKTQELKGRIFREVFPNVREKEFYRQFRKALARNKEVHFEAFSNLTGRWFETHMYPFSGGLSVYLHDISLRKRSDELLHETSAYLESLINYAHAPIIVWGPDFKIARFNHAFEFLSGYEASEMIGKGLEILFPEESKKETITKIERTLVGEQWESVEIPILCKNGDVRMLLWNSANIYRPGNKSLSATIAQGQDITGRKQAEELLKKSRDDLEQRVAQRTADLIKAQKELMSVKRLSDIGALSATVAHELRNPLGVIRAAAFNLRRKNQNPNLGKHLDRIDKKILESDQIINNLLFYSRIKLPHFEIASIPAILKEAIADAKTKYKGSDVIVRIRLGALKTTVVEADPAQLYELFSNILNNAYEAFPEKKGIIEITGIIDGLNRLAKVSFKDNGCGIGEDILHKIQEPFFTTKSQGTGLGLAVCFQVARLHNGNIEITSSKGKGSVFTVILPTKPELEKAG